MYMMPPNENTGYQLCGESIFGVDMSDGKRIGLNVDTSCTVIKITKTQTVKGLTVQLVNEQTPRIFFSDGQGTKRFGKCWFSFLQQI